MTQSIVVQVGQCGNQIGLQFWDRILREHASVDIDGSFNDSVATFFRNVDGKTGHDLPIGSRLKDLKARAVLVDMETRVVDQLLRSPIHEIFDKTLRLTDSYGSGNNWAVGHHVYGAEHGATISELLRRSVEPCDNLQSCFVLHSMSGGTGSGLGTAITKMLAEEYPKTSRFTTCVFSATHEDVITAPYNSVLALKVLTEEADCVISVDNEALMEMCSKGTLSAKKIFPLDLMNDMVANVISDVTSSSRFDGPLNVDLNEISTNLVPFPRMQYLIPGLSPVAVGRMDSKKLDRVFIETFARSSQLLHCDPRSSTYLACLVLARGKTISLSEVRGNIDKMSKNVHFVDWNANGWKIGLCDVPPLKRARSLLTLGNNSCFYKPMEGLKRSFSTAYRARAHLHHYLKHGMERGDFDESLEALDSLIFDYKTLENARAGNVVPPRMKVSGLTDGHLHEKEMLKTE